MLWRYLVLGTVSLVVSALPASVAPQRGGNPFGLGQRRTQFNNVPYDGRFTFVRVRYAGYAGWSFDYPDMEHNLTVMLTELTSIQPNPGSNILTLDDPELLKYPVAYISEPGYWFPTDAEVEGLREYLAKGGFFIVDDFHFENEWLVFQAAMRRVLPNGRIERLELSHPIFHSFFDIKSLRVPYPGRLGEQGLMGEFFGIYMDNDPSKPLAVVINYNMDIGDYMEWSATGLYSAAPTNEAYKFGINYIIYGLTH